LSPDGQKWSGKVSLDELHLRDPLGWKKPALIATGFHGDWGRLSEYDKEMVFCVMALSQQHTFMLLSKCPEEILSWMTAEIPMSDRETCVMGRCDNNKYYGGIVWDTRGSDPANYSYQFLQERIANRRVWPGWPLKNVTLGVSIMNQAEADAHRLSMWKLAKMGWSTHVWYEPALGPVNWIGWEHVSAIIAGGESGPSARPADPDWFRNTRDWCEENHAEFVFKQWGGVNKKLTGCELDGREWKTLPEVW
jgi:protein gp37